MKVDDMLTKFLRAHQREGLQFLFDCVCGLKEYEGQGWCACACTRQSSYDAATPMHTARCRQNYVPCVSDAQEVSRLRAARACSILADDMGLGKTLQGVALLWTLLRSGNEHVGGSPVAKRVMIVCPTSLVNNWDGECKRWLQVRMWSMM